MNTNINLSQLKGKMNANVIIIVALVLLAIVLGFVCWLTFDNNTALEARVATEMAAYNQNRNLLKSLNDLKANSEYYIEQKDKYDDVIAEAGTYNTVDYYVELSELCDRYGLKIDEINVGEMIPTGIVQQATTTLVVIGEEIDVKLMAEHIISQPEIARIDSIAMTEQEDGTVVAALTIVNFTK